MRHDLRDGKVPRNQSNGNTHRLLDNHDPAVGCRGGADVSSNSLSLAREPPRETQRVVELALGLSQRLACLVRENLRNVISVKADETVPFEQLLGATSGVLGTVGLECLVRELDGAVNVGGVEVWARRDDLAVARVLDVELGTRGRAGPFASDVRLRLEQLGRFQLIGVRNVSPDFARQNLGCDLTRMRKCC